MEFVDVRRLYREHREAIDAAIAEVLASGHWILGPKVEQLEHELARYAGVAHCVSCASGTDSLRMALMALDVGPGDEVITVPFTFIATAQTIVETGATPVFVDIEPDGFMIDVDAAAAAITSRTKAIVPVSLFGQMPDMERLNALAARHHLAVIEDAAQSFGATRNGVRSCGASLMASTSFYPSKPLACFGDGGAVFTDDAALAARLRSIRVHGADADGIHRRPGFNARFDAIQAAAMLAYWPSFPALIEGRQRAGARYDRLLAGYAKTPPVLAGNTHVYAQYTLRVEGREALQKRLAAAGIPTRVYYANALHTQPVFAHLKTPRLPVTEQACREVMSLPLHPYLSETEQQQVADALAEALAVSVDGA